MTFFFFFALSKNSQDAFGVSFKLKINRNWNLQILCALFSSIIETTNFSRQTFGLFY